MVFYNFLNTYLTNFLHGWIKKHEFLLFFKQRNKEINCEQTTKDNDLFVCKIVNIINNG